MFKKKNLVELLTGVGVLLTAIVFGLTIYKQKPDKSGRTILLRAEFDSVSGLGKGSAVKVNGVLVGDVKSIELDKKKNYNAVVTFGIDEACPIPTDSQAAIVTETLMGSKVLALSPGVKETYLKPGDIIYDTLPSLNLEDLLQKFMVGSMSKEEEGEGQISHDQDQELHAQNLAVDSDKNLKNNLPLYLPLS